MDEAASPAGPHGAAPRAEPMSFVLDALKVSEQRRSRFSRRIYAHPPRPRRPGRGRKWLVMLGLPAISVPAGFTPEGLPVGIQIVGRHQDDWGVLQLAHAYEQATGFWKRRPPLCSVVSEED